MPTDRERVEKFAKLLITHARDAGIEWFDKASRGAWKAPSLGALQSELLGQSDQQLATTRAAVIEAIDTALHGLMHSLEEAHDFEAGVGIVVDEKELATLTDGLPQEFHGWIERYSRYPERPH